MGVNDGVLYHVLVIEQALRVMRERNNNKKIDKSKENEWGEEEVAEESTDDAARESIDLYVDASDASLIPPPPGALTGMARLLQRAYPDRIHRVKIGPVNGMLSRLYKFVAPYLRHRSREKILLMECAPPSEMEVGMKARAGNRMDGLHKSCCDAEKGAFTMPDCAASGPVHCAADVGTAPVGKGKPMKISATKVINSIKRIGSSNSTKRIGSSNTMKRNGSSNTMKRTTDSSNSIKRTGSSNSIKRTNSSTGITAACDQTKKM